MHWFTNSPKAVSKGYRGDQLRFYRTFVSPLIGGLKLKSIAPIQMSRVFSNPEILKRAGATQRHVFVLLRHVFKDAIERYQLLTFNPVLPDFKPKLPLKEAKHLNTDEIRRLLNHVRERPYGFAVWVQFYLGLRVGEMIALRWSDINLVNGIAHIRRTFVVEDWAFKDYPKGRKQISKPIPAELLDVLKEKSETAASEAIVTSPEGGMVSYKKFLKVLKGYCKELGLTMIGTHGLRHSTSEAYMSHGASRDDLRELFGHSSLAVTDGYCHGRGTNLEKIAKVIRLFPGSDRPRVDHAEGSEKSVSTLEGGKS